jgi:iron complex outermembrane recepter protein
VSGFLSSTGSASTAYSESSERNQGVNPKFGLSWEPDKDLLTYISAAKGFRPGGANQPVPTGGNSALGKACETDLQQIYGTTGNVPSPATFGPDDVWSYELGEKWRTNDNRVSINGAVYYSRWNEAQQFVPLSCGFNFSTNTGDAKIYGAELEVNAALTDDLLLSANGGYTHAEFIASTVLPGVAAANGLGVQEIPDWTSNVSLTYRHPVTNNINLFGRIENTYVASRTEVTFALYTLPSYSLTNLRLGAEGNKWTATLFARNLFNKVAYINNAYQINLNVPTYNRVTVAQPLTVGIDLTYHLGR